MQRIAAIAGTVATAIIGSCAAPNGSASPDGVHIEILGFADCPHTAPFRGRVETAVHRLGGFTVVTIDQESLPPNDLRRGYPAPTALVDGRDLFGLPTPSSPSMSCRVYPGGLPSVEEIEARLRSVRGS